MKQCKKDKLTEASKSSDSKVAMDIAKPKEKKKREKVQKTFAKEKSNEKLAASDRDFNVPKGSQNDVEVKRQNKVKRSKLVSKPSTNVESNENVSREIYRIEEKAAEKQQKRKKKLGTELKSKVSKHNASVAASDMAINNEGEKGIPKTESTNILNEYKNVDLKSLEEATIFIGNLPINTKRIQLARLLKEFGPVKSIRFRTASGKRFFSHKQRKEAVSLNAYVVLQDAQSADRAIALNGIEFKSNHLRITKSNSKNQIDENAKTKNTVFVGNLKYSATEESLHDIFSSCGEIEYVRCLREGYKGCKGVAYICFKNPEAVGLALELNETLLDERPIHVERYSIKKLGAKMARESALQGIKKTNAKRRLKQKEKILTKEKKNTLENDTKEKNKIKFHGVKIKTIKKGKSKKPSKQQIQLAKKIAPKIK